MHHSYQMNRHELDFSSPWNYSDVTLISCSGDAFHVHKCILSMWSKVLAKRIAVAGASGAACPLQIDVDQFKSSSIREFLFEIYSPVSKVNSRRSKRVFAWWCLTPLFTGENVSRLLSLSWSLQIDVLRHRCEDYLLTRPTSLGLLVVAEKFCLHRLSASVVDYASTLEEATLETDAYFRRLSSETRLCVYRRMVEKTREHLANFSIAHQ